jgi:hypothetical protein
MGPWLKVFAFGLQLSKADAKGTLEQLFPPKKK